MPVKKRMALFYEGTPPRDFKQQFKDFVASHPGLGWFPVLRDAGAFRHDREPFEAVVILPVVSEGNIDAIRRVYEMAGVPVHTDGPGPLQEVLEHQRQRETEMEQNREAEAARLAAAAEDAARQHRNAQKESTGSTDPLEPTMTEAERNNPGGIDPRVSPPDAADGRSAIDPAFQGDAVSHAPITGDGDFDERKAKIDAIAGGDKAAVDAAVASGEKNAPPKGAGKAPTKAKAADAPEASADKK